MKLENVRVYNISTSLFGMRNPKNSWNKRDTKAGIATYDEVVKMAEENGVNLKDILLYQDDNGLCEYCIIGPNDMKLAKALKDAGTEHRKYLRQIFVTMDITAPLYWWKEFDTYKIGTTSNSQSTMHKMAAKPITLDCFEIGDYEKDLVFEESTAGEHSWDYKCKVDHVIGGESEGTYYWDKCYIKFLEMLRLKYLETKDVRFWKELIRWLPESWLQTRTITLDYEVLSRMYYQRKDHKLSEWHWFCDRIADMPYAQDLIL